MLNCVSHAQNKVVVIPMSGDDLSPLANIVSVAKANGQFSNPIAAINSIPTTGAQAPSATNQYLIVVAPGEYDLAARLTMRPFISLTGSGTEATTLRGSIGSSTLNESAALIQCANNSEVTGLNIENSASSGSIAIGVYCDSVGDRSVLDDIRVSASGGTARNMAISLSFATPTVHNVIATANGQGQAASLNIAFSSSSSPVTISNLTASAFGGASTIAMHNPFSAVRLRGATLAAFGGSVSNTGVYTEDPFFTNLRDLKINVGGGSGSNYGVYNDQSEPKISDAFIDVSSGTNSYGIYNINGATPILTDVDVTATLATSASYGLYVTSGNTRVRRSSLTGTTDAIFTGANATAIVSNSIVSDGNVGGSGTVTCLYSTSDTGSVAELDTACSD